MERGEVGHAASVDGPDVAEALVEPIPEELPTRRGLRVASESGEPATLTEEREHEGLAEAVVAARPRERLPDVLGRAHCTVVDHEDVVEPGEANPTEVPRGCVAPLEDRRHHEKRAQLDDRLEPEVQSRVELVEGGCGEVGEAGRVAEPRALPVRVEGRMLRQERRELEVEVHEDVHARPDEGVGPDDLEGLRPLVALLPVLRDEQFERPDPFAPEWLVREEVPGVQFEGLVPASRDLREGVEVQEELVEQRRALRALAVDVREPLEGGGCLSDDVARPEALAMVEGPDEGLDEAARGKSLRVVEDEAGRFAWVRLEASESKQPERVSAAPAEEHEVLRVVGRGHVERAVARGRLNVDVRVETEAEPCLWREGFSR